MTENDRGTVTGVWCQTEKPRLDGQTRNSPRTAEGDYHIWRPLLAHGTVVIEILRSVVQERPRRPLSLENLCFEAVEGCQENTSLQQGVQAAASPIYYYCLE